MQNTAWRKIFISQQFPRDFPATYFAGYSPMDVKRIDLQPPTYIAICFPFFFVQRDEQARWVYESGMLVIVLEIANGEFS